MNWIDAIATLSRKNTGFALITVLSTHGSSPRGEQSKMVVTEDKSYDSIGGGNLEFLAIDKARDLLVSGDSMIEREEYTLGDDLTQCCGGQVELLFECYPACDFNIALFGAGHVAGALTRILSELPCQVSWIDSRSELLQAAVSELGSPSNIHPRVMQNPFQSVEQCLANTFYLIMTHSHEIDFELCEAILARPDVRYCGLIGSKSKAAKFRNRLSRKGYSMKEIGQLTSPIGLNLGAGKKPMEVAVSIASQLLQTYYAGKSLENLDRQNVIEIAK